MDYGGSGKAKIGYSANKGMEMDFDKLTFFKTTHA
jgi:hypothetical protein